MSSSGERRKSARYPISVPVRFRLAGEAGERKSTIADVSEGGVSFRSDDPIATGAVVDLALPLEDERFTLTGSVVHCAPETKGGFRVGVALVPPADAFRRKLTEQIVMIEKLREELSQQRGAKVSLEEAAREWVTYYAARFAEIYED